MSIFVHARDLYGRFERPISSISLVFGFVFDALTFSRVDNVWQNVWVLGHIVMIGVFIVVIHLKENKPGDESDVTKAHFWYVNILQFFFGGILSTYLLSYFRSSDILVTWPFVLVLALAFMANEVLKRHYIRLSFQISLYFLSIYAFAIYLVPVVIHKIGTSIFLLSGLVSLVFITIFIYVLFLFIKDKFKKSRKSIFLLIGGIFVVVNIFYFTNLIPPIPLSLKDAGVYHSVERIHDGNYVVKYEDHGFSGYFDLYQDFKKTPGSPVYAFSSVFSPTDLNTTIVHEWEHLDNTSGEWVEDSRINLAVVGGRDNGFRTYSIRMNLAEGKWPVNVNTLDGLLIGRLRFNVVQSLTTPILSTDIK